RLRRPRSGRLGRRQRGDARGMTASTQTGRNGIRPTKSPSSMKGAFDMTTHDDAAVGRRFTRRDILAAGGAAAGALLLGADPVRAAMRTRRANPVEVTM